MRGFRETFSFRAAHGSRTWRAPVLSSAPVIHGMDSFELNKIAGAVLFTILVILSLGIVADAIYGAVKPELPGFEIAVTEPGEGPSVEAGPPSEPIAVRLAKADLAAGEAAAKKCLACHTLPQGQPAKVGPNLWGVVGGPMAHAAGFSYSAAIVEQKAEGATWTFENLDHFLQNPKRFMPGTKMGFIGVRKDDERANLIAYLRTLSDSPVPLPAPVAAAPAEAAPAEGGAPADDTTPPAEPVAPGEVPEPTP